MLERRITEVGIKVLLKGERRKTVRREKKRR